jgi:hAT family C-terminal dimerisation region
MFPHVEALIRLLLVNPASSATAERSFNSLRRLETYLRSTRGQRRLNNLAIRHVHKHIMGGVNVPQLMREFVKAKDIRSQTYRHIIRDAHFD